MKSRVSILTLFLLCLIAPLAATAQSSVKVQGLIQDLPEAGVLGDFVIGGQLVIVTATTEVDADTDQLQLGACVEAEGTLTAGALTADKIAAKDADDCGGVGQTPGASEIKFTATAQSAPSAGLNGTWTIGTWMVSADEFTDFDGDEADFQAGACLEVEGVLLSNGIVRASDIETEDAERCTGSALADEAELRGVIDSLPASGTAGDWMIRGFIVRVSETTEINNNDGAATVGACVKTEGDVDDDGVLEARQVRVLAAESCAAPSESEIEFTGKIDTLPSNGHSGTWTVTGINVTVTNATQLQLGLGPAQTGACVEVQGSAATGAVAAREIRVLGMDCGAPAEGQTQVSFEGQVQSIPPQDTAGVWQISGRTVLVNEATTVDLNGRDPETGACVGVEGDVIAAGTINASSITVLDEQCAGSPGPPELTQIIGKIDTLPAGAEPGDWVVGGSTITVSNATQLNTTNGDFAAGGCVSIAGRQQADGTVLARELETRAAGDCSNDGNLVEFAGIVTARPADVQTGDWTISQQQVAVAASTELETTDGPLGLGSCVEVNGVRGTDGTLTATKVDVESGSGACVLAVVNGGTFQAGPVSPGDIITVFGLGLGPGAGRGLVVENNHVTNNVDGVQVLVDGTPAPILFLSANQVNVVAPYSIAGKTSTTMQVIWAGVFTKTFQLDVAEADPALLTLDQSGRGQAAVLNWEEATQTYSVNSMENPAHPGQIILLYATGEGQTTPAGDDGAVVDANNLTHPNADVSVTIGGLPAEVIYAGGAPTLVSGVLQVNTVVPQDLTATGDVEVILHVGEFQSPEGVTIFVQP